MTDLDLADGSLAGVLAWWSLIHIPDEAVPGVLAQFHRVLRPGGVLAVGFHVGDESETKTSGDDNQPTPAYGHHRPPSRWLTGSGRQVSPWRRNTCCVRTSRTRARSCSPVGPQHRLGRPPPRPPLPGRGHARHGPPLLWRSLSTTCCSRVSAISTTNAGPAQRASASWPSPGREGVLIAPERGLGSAGLNVRASIAHHGGSRGAVHAARQRHVADPLRLSQPRAPRGRGDGSRADLDRGGAADLWSLPPELRAGRPGADREPEHLRGRQPPVDHPGADGRGAGSLRYLDLGRWHGCSERC